MSTLGDTSKRTPTLRSLSHEAQVLLGSDALAHVITQNRDGSPQVSVVWCEVQGDTVRFVTEGDTAKVRNLRRDPKVVLSVEDEERNLRGFQHHLVIRGTARIEDGPAPELFDQLCATYVGRVDTSIPLRQSPSAVVVNVDVEHIGGNGPWVR
jgi:PPOX class probable F420-dependent enzyme